MSTTSTPSAGPSPQFAARHAKYSRPARLSHKKPLPDPPISTYFYHHPLPATVYSPEFDEPDRPSSPTNITGLFDDDDDDSDDSSSSSAATSRAASPVRRMEPQRMPKTPPTPMSPTSPPKSEWTTAHPFSSRPPPPDLIRRPSRKMKAVLGIGMTFPPPPPASRTSTPALFLRRSTRPQESHLPVCDNWDATDSDSSTTTTTRAQPPLPLPHPPHTLLKPWQPLVLKKPPHSRTSSFSVRQSSPLPAPTAPADTTTLDVPARPNSRWSDYSETGSAKESWRSNVLQHLHLPRGVRRPRNRTMSMVSLSLEDPQPGRRLKDIFGNLATGKEERRRRELKRKITVVGTGVDVGYF